MAVDSFGMPVNLIITDGTTSDRSLVTEVISDIQAEFLTTDRAYNCDKVLEKIEKRRMKAVIPPKKVVRNSENTEKTYMNSVICII